MGTQSTYRRVAIIKALAHPARLEIAQALAAGPRCVGDLQLLVGGDFSTVSKHLTLMRRAGWVRCERRGAHVHYHLACDCLSTFLSCVDSLDACDPECC